MVDVRFEPAATAGAPASAPRRCAFCGDGSGTVVAEEGTVFSNVRAHRDKAFRVWRCRSCRSLHARDEVDLDFYYADYPFMRLPLERRARLLYKAQLARVAQAGLRPQHRVLDYGCGGGQLLQYLREQGFADVNGYDQYSERYGDRAVLDGRYDAIVSQDVLEHVPDPLALLDQFDRLVKPGGLIAIGTPNATNLDLNKARAHIHGLHQPYHRHMPSKEVLLAAGAARGWELKSYHAVHHTNTRHPCMNSRFYRYYMNLGDGTMDVLLDPPPGRALLRRLPLTLWLGFFGSFFAERLDSTAIFRKPG